jgi:hypothetical protein
MPGWRRSLILWLALLGAAYMAPAPPVPAAEASFALVPPAQAQALAARNGTPEAAQIRRAADSVLDRAPHAMARIHVEGTLPHQGIYDQSYEALRDMPALRDLALAARLTGEPRYAGAASRLMAAWLATYEPSGNPIDETQLDTLLLAYDVLPEPARTPLAPAMTPFLRRFAEATRRSTERARGDTAINNWQSHRVKLFTLLAYALGEAELVERAHRAFAAQLAANLRGDGTTVDFAQRDAIHYVTYDLEPLLTAALAARLHGADWYGETSPAGASLGGALDWLAPFADGSKSHIEFVHTTVRFDIERKEAGVPGFAGAFEPSDARLTFALAARLDRRYDAVTERLGAVPWIELCSPR